MNNNFFGVSISRDGKVIMVATDLGPMKLLFISAVGGSLYGTYSLSNSCGYNEHKKYISFGSPIPATNVYQGYITNSYIPSGQTTCSAFQILGFKIDIGTTPLIGTVNWVTRTILADSTDDPLGIFLSPDETALYQGHFRAGYVHLSYLVPWSGIEKWTVNSVLTSSPYVNVMDVSVTALNEHTVVSVSERGASQGMRVMRAVVTNGIPSTGGTTYRII